MGKGTVRVERSFISFLIITDYLLVPLYYSDTQFDMDYFTADQYLDVCNYHIIEKVSFIYINNIITTVILYNLLCIAYVLYIC